GARGKWRFPLPLGLPQEERAHRVRPIERVVQRAHAVRRPDEAPLEIRQVQPAIPLQRREIGYLPRGRFQVQRPRSCSHLSSVLRPEKLGSWMTRARGRGREELEVYERAFGSHVARQSQLEEDVGDGSAAWWFSAVGTRDGRDRTCWNHNLGVSILDEQTVTCGRAPAREHDRGVIDLAPRFAEISGVTSNR